MKRQRTAFGLRWRMLLAKVLKEVKRETIGHVGRRTAKQLSSLAAGKCLHGSILGSIRMVPSRPTIKAAPESRRLNCLRLNVSSKTKSGPVSQARFVHCLLSSYAAFLCNLLTLLEALTGIFRVFVFASSVFGRVILNTPLSKWASILSVKMFAPSGRLRRKDP